MICKKKFTHWERCNPEGMSVRLKVAMLLIASSVRFYWAAGLNYLKTDLRPLIFQSVVAIFEKDRPLAL